MTSSNRHVPAGFQPQEAGKGSEAPMHKGKRVDYIDLAPKGLISGIYLHPWQGIVGIITHMITASMMIKMLSSIQMVHPRIGT